MKNKNQYKKRLIINNLLFIFKILIIFFFFIFTMMLLKKWKTNNNNIEQIISFYEKKNQKNNEILLKKLKKYLLKFKRDSIDWPLPKEIFFKPLMTSKEIKAFLFFMKPGNIYFEFGAGGSTNIASYYKLKTYSVESDVRWHQKLKDKNIKAHYITIDLKSYHIGYPGKEITIKDWKKYIQSYKKEYNADIILIDGRFRVACGLDIFSKIKNDCIVLIHDYTDRYDYHILEKFYLKIEEWDTLTAFIKRPNINFIPIKIYKKYLNDKF